MRLSTRFCGFALMLGPAAALTLATPRSTYMVSRGEEKYIIWPIYFDKSVSRFSGRKVSKKYAVEKPLIEKLDEVGGEISKETKKMLKNFTKSGMKGFLRGGWGA